ncbi:MAG: class I SAM-dependent methyltransferase [Chloroflexota bacterium]|nr:class I SAM-dependent methyltransferase [Chloroflexota bacterium]
MSSARSAPLYDNIGVHYDSTRRADPHLTERLAHNLALRPGGRYLDIACGTGNYTHALAEKGGDWYGVDVSSGMLRRAQAKGANVGFLLGDAAALPFRDGSFDGAICTMALHHLPRLEPVYSEIRRLLRGGKLVMFTSTAEQMAGYWLNEYFPIAMQRSTAQMPSQATILEALAAADLSVDRQELYDVREDLEDLFLYAGKRRPELYLSATIRRGISTFSTVAEPAELEAGTLRLARDISSGKIKEVAQRYANQGGDYMFIVASRSARRG